MSAPEWIVNDLGELGVLVNGICYFCYKGDSIVYEEGTHENGQPMVYRHIGKREFGETVWPAAWNKQGREGPLPYNLELVHDPILSDGDPDDPKYKWRALPVCPADMRDHNTGSKWVTVEDPTVTPNFNAELESWLTTEKQDDTYIILWTTLKAYLQFLWDKYIAPHVGDDWTLEFKTSPNKIDIACCVNRDIPIPVRELNRQPHTSNTVPISNHWSINIPDGCEMWEDRCLVPEICGTSLIPKHHHKYWLYEMAKCGEGCRQMLHVRYTDGRE